MEPSHDAQAGRWTNKENPRTASARRLSSMGPATAMTPRSYAKDNDSSGTKIHPTYHECYTLNFARLELDCHSSIHFTGRTCMEPLPDACHAARGLLSLQVPM